MKTKTEQQKQWFAGLQKIREHLAEAFELSAASGVQDSVVKKYSDQAHFIYELLQNADDAGATKASFELQSKELIFRHNGTVHFTVSEPDNLNDKQIEKRDKDRGQLGHINSICSVGNSSKEIEDNTIGKFGVGFKAVFQYTNTPHIYDPNFKFKIERFIVPVLIDNDFHNREVNETLFRFPFNHPDMPEERAYLDIEEKLKSLIHPTLFLNNLKNVNWNSETKKGKYYKEILKADTSDNIDYEVINPKNS